MGPGVSRATIAVSVPEIPATMAHANCVQNATISQDGKTHTTTTTTKPHRISIVRYATNRRTNTRTRDPSPIALGRRKPMIHYNTHGLQQPIPKGKTMLKPPIIRHKTFGGVPPMSKLERIRPRSLWYAWKRDGRTILGNFTRYECVKFFGVDPEALPC